jgi:hypothetical protein
VSPEQLVTLANFASLPHADILYDAPGFHSDGGLDLRTIRGSESHRRITGVVRELAGKARPLWLFYDEQNFSTQRLTGWRWNVLRRFFEFLCSPMRCIGCGTSIRRFALDHIAPIAKRHFQTLPNFQPLCKMCNSAKGDREGDDPFGVRLLIPQHLRTNRLDQIMRQRPEWLGFINRPQSSIEIQTSLERVGAA